MALFLRGLCLLAGYLLGGFLTAEVVARCTAGVSARDIGTGNPGMANIATHLGKKAGLLVLAGDVIKTAAACWFCHQLAPELGLTALLYGGLGAVLGHNWPIWYKGRGGKGVAVAAGTILAAAPRVFVALLVVFVGWGIFAMEDLSTLSGYLAVCFGGAPPWSAADGFMLRSDALTFLVLAAASTRLGKNTWQRLPDKAQKVLAPAFMLAALVISTAYLVDGSYNPFLYFRF